MTKIFIALDLETPNEAVKMAALLDHDLYKIGLELIYHPEGNKLVRFLIDNGKTIFLDAKLSDIPTTIFRTTRQIIDMWAPQFLSVRCGVEAAMEAAHKSETMIVHVPSLTSDYTQTVEYSPASAIVCANYLINPYRLLMPNALIITPGVRLPDDHPNDHIMPLDPSLGIANSDFCVIGRPITRNNDPKEALNKFLHFFAKPGVV